MLNIINESISNLDFVIDWKFVIGNLRYTQLLY